MNQISATLYREEKERLLFGFLKNYNSEHTRAAYARDLKDYLKFLLMRFRITERLATQAHIVAFKEYLSGNIDRPLSQSSINRKLAVVSAFYNYLCEEGILKDNPAKRVRRFKDREIRKTRALSVGEFHHLIAVIDSSSLHGKMHLAIINIIFRTGMRVSELCSLKFSMIERNANGVSLRFIGKGGKERVSYLDQYALTALGEYVSARIEKEGPQDKSVYIFRATRSRDNKCLTRQAVRKLIIIHAQESEIGNGINPHSARATYITVSLKNGQPIHRVMRKVGHSDIKTTLSYLDCVDE